MEKIIFANPLAGNALAKKLDDKQFTIITDLNQYDNAINAITTETQVIIAGGDGTIHLIINKLFNANKLPLIKFSILPIGTGNDLARCVGSLNQSTEWFTSNDFTEKRLPLWKMTRTTKHTMEQHIFINFIGIGIDANVVARAEALRSWRNRIYTQAMYVVTALTYISYRLPKHTRISVDQQQIICKSGIILANTNSYAGGCKLGDGRDNHNLQLNVFKLQSWFGLVNIILTRILKNTVRRPDAIARAAEIYGENLPIEMDGEFLAATSEVATIRVEPAHQQLTLWIPTGA